MNPEQLRQAGFSEGEVKQYTDLVGAGFSEKEIADHYAKKPASPPAGEKPKSGDVPAWGARNPNLYGAYGAGKELLRAATEGAALTGGAIAGTAVGGPVGGVAGAGLLYGGVKAAERALEGGNTSLPRAALTSGKDVLEGAGLTAGAQSLALLAKVATPYAQKLKEIIKPSPTAEEALGQILQGKGKNTSLIKADITKGEKALSAIDTTSVKTYPELSAKINEAIPKYAEQVDAVLMKDPKIYTMGELSTTGKTPTGYPVTQNYVQTALENLQELYVKTNNPVKAKTMEGLLSKANDNGLTKLEVNNIARQYGAEFNAFNPTTGAPPTTVNKAGYENVRSGLKEVARRGLDNTAKDLDSTISSLYNTQRLIDKRVAAVNELRQRIQQRGLFEKIGGKAVEYLDLATLGTLKGAVVKLFPRGMGFKVKNALDLEESLSRNLEIVNKALASKTDAELIKTVKEAASMPASSSYNVDANKSSAPINRLPKTLQPPQGGWPNSYNPTIDWGVGKGSGEPVNMGLRVKQPPPGGWPTREDLSYLLDYGHEPTGTPKILNEIKRTGLPIQRFPKR